MNNISLTQALVFEPRRAFTELDARPRFQFPLWLLVLGSVLLSCWYTAFVDLEWLTDTQLHASAFTQNMTDAEIARMASVAAQRQGVQVVMAGLSTAVVITVVVLISALYFLIAGNVTGVKRSYRHWLSLTSWTSLPTVVSVIPAALMLLTASSNQIGQEALQPLSLNALLLHRAPADPGYTLFSNMNLFQLVSIYLAAFGVKVWSDRSWTFAIVFAALPTVLIYGIWSFFALR